MQIADPSLCQSSEERYASVPIVQYTHALAVNGEGKIVDENDGVHAWSFKKTEHVSYYPAIPLRVPPQGTPSAITAIATSVNEVAMRPDVWLWWQAHMEPTHA